MDRTTKTEVKIRTIVRTTKILGVSTLLATDGRGKDLEEWVVE